MHAVWVRENRGLFLRLLYSNSNSWYQNRGVNVDRNSTTSVPYYSFSSLLARTQVPSASVRTSPSLLQI